MKSNICFVALLFFCLGCNSQKVEQLTQDQKDHIKTQVKAIIDSVVVQFVKLDAEGALQYYSPEMLATADSSIVDHKTYCNSWIEFNKAAVSITWTQKQLDAFVLSNDYAVSYLIGRLEIVLKSGMKMTMENQFYTDIFKQIDGQWKIIYEHSSGIPVTEKVGKK